MPNATFLPQWSSPPGETMSQLIRAKGLALSELAVQLGWTAEEAQDLLAARRAITFEVAGVLADAIGGTRRFWLTRESQYRDDLARLQQAAEEAEASGWLRSLPVKEMVSFGWLPETRDRLELARSCLRFFEVESIHEWQHKCADLADSAALRTSGTFPSSVGALASWLQRGEIEAQSATCASWSPTGFRQALDQIRALTRQKEPAAFLPELKRICSAHGVAVVAVRAPKGCRASGATRFVTPQRALLLLSFRYRSDDHFWFTFFHEAGHLLLHGESGSFIEDEGVGSSRFEEEANRFAEDVLIPSNVRPAFGLLRNNTRDAIRFALRAGISPGIVVGQLQKQGRVPQNQLNRLKRRYQWSDT